MFEAYSRHSMQIVFAARFKAGQRGATSVGCDDSYLARSSKIKDY